MVTQSVYPKNAPSSEPLRVIAGVAVSETELSKAIQNIHDQLGIPCERIQSGVIPARGRRIHCARPGTPDRWSALAFWELKLPGQKLTPEQEAWHARAKQWGQRVEVVQSVEQGARRIRELLQQRRHEERMGWL